MTLLWTPKHPEESEMEQFRHFINKKYQLDLSRIFNVEDYQALWQFSVSRIDHFWSSVWEYCQVIGTDYHLVLWIDLGARG